MSEKDDALVEILRAAGHTEAADLASAVIDRTRAGKPAGEEPPAGEGERKAPPAGYQHASMQLVDDAAYGIDEATRAAGREMLEQMRAQGIVSAQPTDGEAA